LNPAEFESAALSVPFFSRMLMRSGIDDLESLLSQEGMEAIDAEKRG
jgi:hypothetical protein